MAIRQVPTWLVLLLSLLAGMGLGVIAGREWDAYEWRVRHLARQTGHRLSRQADSARLAEFARLDSARRLRDSLDPMNPPMEVERVQGPGGCIITFLMRDNRAAEMPLFHASARDWHDHPLTRQYDYNPAGFPKGSLAHVVFPAVECGQMRVDGWGAGMIFRQERGLDVR